MVTFLTLTRQFFLHTTPIDVINSWGISKMYATQIVKNVNGEDFTMAAFVMQVNGFLFRYFGAKLVLNCLARQVGTQGPSLGHSGTKPWALRDQALGIDRPSDGHTLPVRCAQSAQTLGNFWATLILSQNYNKFGTRQCFCTKKLLILMPI